MTPIVITIGIFCHIVLTLMLVVGVEVKGGINTKGSTVLLASLFGVIYFWVVFFT